MARIDIEIEEYLDEVRSKYLFDELKKRKDFKILIEDYYQEMKLAYIIPDFKVSDDVLDFLKIVLNLKKWDTKDKIIEAIKEL